jgi:transposase
LQLRAVGKDKRAIIVLLAGSRTAPALSVERTQVVEAALQGTPVDDIAARQTQLRGSVYLWLHRFEVRGIAGLQDHPRGGRPPTYSGEQVNKIIATVLSDPQKLGLPYAAWTLDRLVAYLAEHRGIRMKRSRLDEVLVSEGLRWRKQENWFGERVDPDFAAKRGAIERLYTAPQPAASSSVSTRWVRRRQRPSRA